MEEEPESGEKRKEELKMQRRDRETSRERYIGRVGKGKWIEEEIKQNRASYGLCLSKAQDFI